MSRAAYFRKWHARNPQYRHDWQRRAGVTQGKWAFIFGIRVRVNLVARDLTGGIVASTLPNIPAATR